MHYVVVCVVVEYSPEKAERAKKKMRSYQLCVEHNWLLSLLSRRQANAKMIMFSIPRDSLNLYKYYAKMPNALLQWKQGLESSGTKLAKLIEKHHKGKRESRGNLQKAGLKVMWKMCWVFSFCVRSEKWPIDHWKLQKGNFCTAPPQTKCNLYTSTKTFF